MDEWTVHMAPEIIRFVFALFIHQPQPSPNDILYNSHPRSTQVCFVNDFHSHASFEWILHALRHLKITGKRLCKDILFWLSDWSSTKRNIKEHHLIQALAKQLAQTTRDLSATSLQPQQDAIS